MFEYEQQELAEKLARDVHGDAFDKLPYNTQKSLINQAGRLISEKITESIYQHYQAVK